MTNRMTRRPCPAVDRETSHVLSTLWTLHRPHTTGPASCPPSGRDTHQHDSRLVPAILGPRMRQNDTGNVTGRTSSARSVFAAPHAGLPDLATPENDTDLRAKAVTRVREKGVRRSHALRDASSWGCLRPIAPSGCGAWSSIDSRVRRWRGRGVSTAVTERMDRSTL